MAAFGGWRLTRTGILFVVGILVLGGIVTGSIFLVKNHGEAVRRDQAVKVAEQNLKDQSSSTSTTAVKDSDNSDSNKSDNSQTNTGTATPAGTSADSATTATDGTNPGALPTTGIDDFAAIGHILIVTMLALSVTFYISSRRPSSRDGSRL